VFAQPEVRHVSNSSYLFTALCGWKGGQPLGADRPITSTRRRRCGIGMVNEVVPARTS